MGMVTSHAEAFHPRATEAGRSGAADDRAVVLGSLAALVTFVVGGLFEYSLGDTEVLLVAAALMALPFALAAEPAAAVACPPA
jgi:hypothetical protein